MKKLIAIILLLASPLAFGAGSTITGRIGFIHVMGNGLIYVDIREVTIPRANVPACSKYPVRFVFDATTDAGQMMFTSIMKFQTSSQRILVTGTGTCMPGGYEIIDFIGLFHYH